jgi:hypothetical protein
MQTVIPNKDVKTDFSALGNKLAAWRRSTSSHRLRRSQAIMSDKLRLDIDTKTLVLANVGLAVAGTAVCAVGYFLGSSIKKAKEMDEKLDTEVALRKSVEQSLTQVLETKIALQSDELATAVAAVSVLRKEKDDERASLIKRIKELETCVLCFLPVL